FISIYLLVGGLAFREQATGFLLSSLVTVLTTYGIVSQAVWTDEGSAQPEAEEPVADFGPESLSNVAALQEQLASLTRQLSAEKRRTTQLMLLNELSQQLEAELDPPVAAQLAVNTLERAMDSSYITLLAPEGDGQ